MSDQVKPAARYSITGDGWEHPVHDPDGPWVKFEDYDQEKARADAAETKMRISRRRTAALEARLERYEGHPNE